MAKQILFLIICTVILSCSDTGKKNTDVRNNVSTQTKSDTPDKAGLIPSSIDSLEIIYYKKPFLDSTRYTRYFLITKTPDSIIVAELNRICQGYGVKLSELRKCQSEGKIVIPIGGDAFKVVYFSRTGGDCSYVYIIKDGEFYYYKMSDLLVNRLDIQEKRAIEPH